MSEYSHGAAAPAVPTRPRTAACVALLMLALATAACGRAVQVAGGTQTEPAGDLLISNVHVFDAATGAFSQPADILIRDGRIHAVGSLREMDRPQEEIDGRGAFALPGLWDSHVHLDFTSLEGPDAVRKTLEGFVNAGVLYVRDVGGPLEGIAAIRDRVRTGAVVGPEIFFSGPLAERPPLFWAALNENLPGTTVPIESAAQVDSLVASVARAGGSFVNAQVARARDTGRHGPAPGRPE